MLFLAFSAMRHSLITLFILFSVAAGVSAQQQVLLLTEDFEQPSNTFAFDTGGIGNTSGNNRWVINTQYDGGGVYPNTISQDSTTTGTITNAPFSTYLHIHDENRAPAIANANYDATSASDRFVYTDRGFCTLGMRDIILAFFYLCEGSATAYGEVYYSIDGGPWVQTGSPRYSNQLKWRYVTISEPAFANVSNLRFGFRWVNNAGAPPSTTSFAIDDIIVVGTYDQTSGPQITIPSISPNPVCRLNPLIVQWQISSPLCDGTYRFELSNSSGNFPATPTSLGVFGINNPQTAGAVAVIIPGSTPPGSCYRVRLVRISPPPVIVGEASVCFAVQACPNTITTLAPIVTTDPDTVCSLSAIDVPFISRGVFNANNIYIAQLSDSSGSFNNPQTLGTLPSSQTFDPAIGAMPGTVSGLIPRVPAGCNYYIRVISTNPAVTGTLYGPFCIKQCDITTNETLDIQICLRGNQGQTDTVEIDIHEWNTDPAYLAGNSFTVQLLDMMTLGVVNTGGLGVVFDTASTTLLLVVPPLNDLIALGILPGAYYMRIIADNSTTPWNTNGTIIRLTIGAPADNLSIVPEQTVYCNTEIAALFIVPYNPDSDYEWLSTSLNNGAPFSWPFHPLLIDFSGPPPSTPGPYSFRVRETNFGCVGNYSPLATIFIISIPDVNISGPTTVCQGDTFLYSVSFLPETYYEWTLSWGTIVDTSNNQIIVTFDSTGTVEINLYALNNCGVRTSSYTVEVVEVISVDAGDDTEICLGDNVTLEAAGAGFNLELTTTLAGNNSAHGNMFNLRAEADVIITGFEARLITGTTVDAALYYRPASYIGSETDPSAWTLLSTVSNITADPTGAPTFLPFNINIPIQTGREYGFYITTTNSTNLLHAIGTTVGADFISDGNLTFIQGHALNYPFNNPVAPRVWGGNILYFTESGVNYLWSTGETTAEITVQPEVTTNYLIRVFDENGCGSSDDVNIIVNPLPSVFAGVDDTLLCRGESLQLLATGADSYTWSPATGLSQTDISNPTTLPAENIVYLLQGVDTVTGCINYDTLRLTVESCELIIKVPQAFTPNGDGINDRFTVFGDNIDFYEIRIFNRWGEQVYYSNNPDEISQGDLNKGWDGTHRGSQQDTGVYTYFIKAGKGNEKPAERKGNVTLIR